MAMPPTGAQYSIAVGSQQATITEIGAGLRVYRAAGHDIVDGFDVDQACTAVRGQVLLPWPNRIEDGRYTFEGVTHQLAITEPARNNAIHGLVRTLRWARVHQSAGRVELALRLRHAPGYPFELDLRASYALTERGLAVSLSATNAGNGPLPYGAGAHPYLKLSTPVIDALALQIPAAAVLRPDARGLPGGPQPVDGTEYDFRSPRTIGQTVFDHTFASLSRDSNGLAHVRLGDRSGRAITLWMDASFGYVHAFSGDPLPDIARRSIAIEPMTCAPNAFRTGEGLRVLRPGEKASCAWGITPVPLS